MCVYQMNLEKEDDLLCEVDYSKIPSEELAEIDDEKCPLPVTHITVASPENESELVDLTVTQNSDDQPKDYSYNSAELNLLENPDSPEAFDVNLNKFLQENNIVEKHILEARHLHQVRRQEAQKILASSKTHAEKVEALKNEFWIIHDEDSDFPIFSEQLAADEALETDNNSSSSNKQISRTFMCHICGQILKGRGNLKKHVDRHTGDKSFSCSTCGKNFSSSSYLKAHARLHTEKRPYSCPKCYKSFKSRSSLRAHLSVHITGKPFKCDICQKIFKTKDHLRSHSKIHSETPFPCSKCSETFLSRRKLRDHTRKIHTEYNFQCPDCPKKFPYMSTLTKHSKFHTGVKPYKCGICDSSFAWKSSLQAHKRVHQLRLQCEFCPKKFLSSVALANHRSRHKEGKRFKCEKCEKAFQFPHQLKKHLSRHKEHLTCEECGKGFITKVKFKQHMKAHSKKEDVV